MLLFCQQISLIVIKITLVFEHEFIYLFVIRKIFINNLFF